MAYDIFAPQSYSLGLDYSSPQTMYGMGGYQPQSLQGGMGMENLDFNSLMQSGYAQSVPAFAPPQSVQPVTTNDPRKGALQRIADMIAGDQYPDANQFDKDKAMGNAMMTLGTALIGAANAGSWSGAAPILGKALPTAVQSFDSSLGQYEQNRQQIADREQVLRVRKMQEQSTGLDLAKKSGDMQDEEAIKSALESSGQEFQAQFDNIINDKDIDETKRSLYRANFSALMKAFNAAPTPQGQQAIINYLGVVGKDAGATEEVDTMLAQELHKSFEIFKQGNPDGSFEDYQKYLHVQFTDEQKKKALELAGEQARVDLIRSQSDYYSGRNEAKVSGANNKDASMAVKEYKDGWSQLSRDAGFKRAIMDAESGDYSGLQQYDARLSALGMPIVALLNQPGITEEKKKEAFKRLAALLSNPMLQHQTGLSLYQQMQNAGN